MLFEAFIRGLEAVGDVIEFGPVKAVQINTSFCPEAERDTARILGNLERENYTSTRLYTEPTVIEDNKSVNESVLDKEEEDMIRKAVAEKSHY